MILITINHFLTASKAIAVQAITLFEITFVRVFLLYVQEVKWNTVSEF